MKDKNNLSIKGIQKLVGIKASIGRGLSEKLLNKFSNIKPVNRPLVKDMRILHPHSLTGFTTNSDSVPPP